MGMGVRKIAQYKDNNTPSVCSKVVDFSISYIYSYKIKDQNSANMIFLVKPSFKKLSYMNFNNYIQTSLPSTYFSSHYDYSDSTLVISFTYDTNI
jgi:hypothetical protein